MKRVLDELADGLHAMRPTGLPRVIIDRVELGRQFKLPITPRAWHTLAGRLACILPSLQSRRSGLWSFPNRCNTVWDLARFVADQHTDWETPPRMSVSDWREAQVFAGVRACLVDALNVDSEEVVRSARLQADLGAE
jgi:hypothetical protein